MLSSDEPPTQKHYNCRAAVLQNLTFLMFLAILCLGYLLKNVFVRKGHPMRKCFSCGSEVSSRERVPFKELCPHCEAFLHCCMNCRLYSPDAHNHCLSPTTEHVPDVERGNFCDEFEFRQIVTDEPDTAGDEAKPRNSESRGLSAREKFENLFKD